MLSTAARKIPIDLLFIQQRKRKVRRTICGFEELFSSFVALALIPEEDVYLGFQKLKETTAKMQNEKIGEFLSYFEATWLGKRQGNAPKTNNSVEGWHRAIKGSLGYVHPAILKFIDFLRREQSAAENKLISLQAGKEFPKSVHYQKNVLRIKNILEGY